MKILYIGCLLTEETKSISTFYNEAGRKYQLNLLEYLHQKLKNDLDVVIIPSVPPYPMQKTIRIKAVVTFVTNELLAKSIGFINFPVLKQVIQTFAVIKQVLVWCHKNKNEKKIILTFNFTMNTSFAALIARCLGKAKFIGYIVDPPIMRQPNINLYNVLKNWYLDFGEHLLKRMDAAIIISKNIKDRFLRDIPFIVVDNGFSEEAYQSLHFLIKEQYREEKIVLFAGSLAEHNGTKQMVETFEYFKGTKVYLWVFGNAELTQYVINASLLNPNIIYKGYIDNKKLLETLPYADLLLNPRPPYNDGTDCTFPSKITEYLISGVPVLSSRLGCFGDEYNDLMYFIEDYSCENMAKEIQHILDLPIVEKKSHQEYTMKYMRENKTWSHLIDKIMTFLYNIAKE